MEMVHEVIDMFLAQPLFVQILILVGVVGALSLTRRIFGH